MLTMEVINSTRPCIARISVRVERTDEELQKLFRDAVSKTYGAPYPNITIDTQSKEYQDFCRTNRAYWEKREVRAEWHMFGQETEEDSNGNIQYPIAVIELEDGTVKTVSADNIKFIKEDSNNE